VAVIDILDLPLVWAAVGAEGGVKRRPYYAALVEVGATPCVARLGAAEGRGDAMCRPQAPQPTERLKE
jgi:hypothetical protein